MIFRKTKKRANTSFLSFDRFITGIIIGGAAASIFWLSKTPKGRTILSKIGNKAKNLSQFGLKTFWVFSVHFLNIFTKNK